MPKHTNMHALTHQHTCAHTHQHTCTHAHTNMHALTLQHTHACLCTPHTQMKCTKVTQEAIEPKRGTESAKPIKKAKLVPKSKFIPDNQMNTNPHVSTFPLHPTKIHVGKINQTIDIQNGYLEWKNKTVLLNTEQWAQ